MGVGPFDSHHFLGEGRAATRGFGRWEQGELAVKFGIWLFFAAKHRYLILGFIVVASFFAMANHH